ncbi:hypothetical protein CRG98_020227, partial [Punica granatum]
MGDFISVTEPRKERRKNGQHPITLVYICRTSVQVLCGLALLLETAIGIAVKDSIP